MDPYYDGLIEALENVQKRAAFEPNSFSTI